MRLQLGVDRGSPLRGRPRETRATRSGARRPGCARQIDVCPFKSGELALAHACVDAGCVEGMPERLDLEQRRGAEAGRYMDRYGLITLIATRSSCFAASLL